MLMTGTSRILPFLEKAAPVFNKLVNISTRDLFITREVEAVAAQFKAPATFVGVLARRIPTVYLVKPMGILIMAGSDIEIAVYKSNFNGLQVNLITVDYAPVANLIDVQYNGSKPEAVYPYNNGNQVERLFDTFMIDAAITGQVLSVPMQNDPVGGGNQNVIVAAEANSSANWYDWSGAMSKWDYRYSALEEEVTLADFGSVLASDALEVESPQTAEELRLESYFTGGYTTSRTPLLVGPSAVAKSSTVKQLAEKHGMRLVDLRLAFTSRLDIEGLTGRYEKDGMVMSEASPASFMLECSDDYVDFCRETVALLETRMATLSDDEKQGYEFCLKKFREGAKIPVLFLDEVTRAPASVRQAFTKILSDKEFMGYPMSYARVIAATNAPLGAPAGLEDIYLTQDAGDAAFFDRFESIQVTPVGVFEGWKRWADSVNSDGVANIHPLVLGYIGDDPKRAYDFDSLYEVYQKTGNENDVTSAPYPNYRTWEMISRYLYQRDSIKKFSPLAISGLIGENGEMAFSAYLRNAAWTVETPPTDEMTNMIQQGLDANVPVMMITPSSLGKCLTAGHWLLVDGEFRMIQDLEYSEERSGGEDSYLDAVYGVESILGDTVTEATFIQDVFHTIKLTTKEGRSIQGTPDHPVLVVTAGSLLWKVLADIDPATDKLVGVPRQAYYPVAYNQYADPSEVGRKTPENLLSYMASLLSSPNCFKHPDGGLYIPVSDMGVGLDMTIAWLQMLGYSPTIETMGSGEVFRLYQTDAVFMVKNLQNIITRADIVSAYEPQYYPTDDNFNLYTIESVEHFADEKVTVYDIVVPYGTSFIANGLWAHNTARVKALVKERNSVLIDVNLAEQDRVDLLGPPVRVATEKYVGSNIKMLSPEDQDQLRALVKTHNLPSHVTVKAPKEELVTKLQQAAATGREVIIHFDELNRVSNQSVMSAVFECISDARVMGVKFDPKNVRVLASCNMGDNYQDAQPLDPAFSARFLMYRRNEYRESDVQSFIEYIKKAKFDPIIIEFFESTPMPELLKIISSVETRTLETSSASTRAWDDLNKYLSDSANRAICGGTVMFTNTSEAALYETFYKSLNNDSFTALNGLLSKKMSKWSGINAGITVPITTAKGREEVSSDALYQMVESERNRIQTKITRGETVTPKEFTVFKNLMLYFYSMNTKIAKLRGEIFQMSLGDNGAAFATYYNTLSGTSISKILIEDCVDNATFAEFIAQQLNGNLLPGEVTTLLIQLTGEFAKTFPTAGSDRDRFVIQKCMDSIKMSENKAEYIKALAFDDALTNFLLDAENASLDYSLGIIAQTGVMVDPERVEQARKIKRKPRMG